MKRILPSAVGFLLLVDMTWVVVGPAVAGTADFARFAVHRMDPTTKQATICTTYSPNAQDLPCSEYKTEGPAPGASLIYLVVGRGPTPGINGASFGIDYNGRAGEGAGIDPDYNVFTPCFDGLMFSYDGGFGEFPAPKSGLEVIWETCQTERPRQWSVHAIVGALYVYAYSEDDLQLTPNNNPVTGPELTVATCDGRVTELLEIYPVWLRKYLTSTVHLATPPLGGVNACGDYFESADPSTWGRLKALYSNPRR